MVDVGCGAGFPGMPLHILCPSCELTLLDSLGKRIRFLQGCIDAMNLSDIEAVHARAEEFAAKHREQYDFAVSRAVAQLNVLAELSLPLVKQGGAFIAMKSKDTDEELEQAKKAIRLLGGEIEKIYDSAHRNYPPLGGYSKEKSHTETIPASVPQDFCISAVIVSRETQRPDV